jgi:hypothetical protein
MLDILDAPVPFLVGLHSRYLRDEDPKWRPKSVVFVDLDRDVVHLGFDEDTGEARKTPCLPPRDAQKLKVTLDECGGSVYIIPDSGIKGCIMSGETLLLMNEERETYAHMSNIVVNAESLGRAEVFACTDKAYHSNDLSERIGGFLSVNGQLSNDSNYGSGDSNGSSQRKPKGVSKKKRSFLRTKKSNLQDYDKARGQGHLLGTFCLVGSSRVESSREQSWLNQDINFIFFHLPKKVLHLNCFLFFLLLVLLIDMTEPDGFSSAQIRSAFLRFFVTVFNGYESFLLTKSGNDLFDEDEFVEEMQLSASSLQFLQVFLKTQMFQTFLEERQDNPGQPELRFFDESIIAKRNRSKRANLKNGGKKATPFLDDESGKVSKFGFYGSYPLLSASYDFPFVIF